jgi:protein TonB
MPHVDILDERERLGKPLIGSVALHVLVAAVLVTGPLLTRGNRVPWGSQDAGGGMGAISVNVVGRVPLPAVSGRINPLASDTEAQVPAPPPKAKEQRRAREPEPDAIPIHSKNAPRRPAPESASANKWRAQQQDRPNQMYGTTGQGLVSQLIGQEGSGGVGIGAGTPFGNRFGTYALILKQTVARNWNTADIDARIRTAPPVIVTFTILRNGQVKTVRVTQRSGNPLLDTSCERAVYDSSFPPLPAEYEGSDVTVDFWFHLSR